jgi:hypothetical protein
MNTRFILPAWWVRAYEAAAAAEAKDDGDGRAMSQALSAGLSPAFSTVELNALAVIIANLQDQLLSGRELLTVDPDEHGKHLSTSVKTRRFAAEKVTQLLASLAIFQPVQDQDKGQAPLSAYKPFVADAWRREPASGDWRIELQVAERGAELLFGLSDGYRDALGAAHAEAGAPVSVAPPAVNRHAPLALWRSIWHELQGAEQQLLLRFERAMQWDFNWLTLEGTFGLGLGELCRGLAEPKGANKGDGKADGLELARQLKLLAKLGKKLAEHGFLAPAASGQYLALGHGQDAAPQDARPAVDLTLVWQLSRERLLADPLPAFREKVTARLSRRYEVSDAAFADLLLLLNGRPPAAATAHFWRSQRARLAALAAEHGAAAPAELLAASQVAPFQLLFLELALRSQRGTGLPLPEELTGSGLARVVAGSGDETAVAECFVKFVALLASEPEWLRILREQPLACVASATTQAEPGFKDRCRRLFTPAAALATPGEAGTASGPAQRDAAASGLAGTEGAQARATAALSGALAARMRRTASEELDKMRAQFQDRYRDLKRAYLASLDEPGRQLLLDVQRRMQSMLFEEHLRQRLVRFMVENPGAWRTVERGRAGAPAPTRLADRGSERPPSRELGKRSDKGHEKLAPQGFDRT